MNYIIYILIAVVAIYLISKLMPGKPSGYENISSQELNSMLKKKSVTLIDVRTPAEMRGGVIGKPKKIELNNNFKSKASQLDKDKTYVVYCRSGRRSAVASKILAGLGFENVLNLSGGYSSYRGL